MGIAFGNRGLRIGDEVVAHDDVVEGAKGMSYDVSGIGIVEQLTVGRPTEQALVAFPNWRGWIYVHELRQPFH